MPENKKTIPTGIKTKAKPRAKAKVEERATFKIDDTDYYLDSFSDDDIKTLESINVVDSEIRSYNTKIEICKIARDTYSRKIVEAIDTFEKVQTKG